MKRVFMIILALSVLTGTLTQAKKLAVLKDLMRPDMIAVENDRVYVSQGASIFIYSIKDIQLVKKFGKPGEGPQEFKVSPFGIPMIITPFLDKLYVSSQDKLSVFTQDGQYIKESKIPPFSVFMPFGKMYVASGMGVDEKKQNVLTVNLHNEKLERVKELYKSDITVGPANSYNYPTSAFLYIPYKDKLYIVVGKEGFSIDVFDEKGAKLYNIKKPYKELPVPGEYKDNTLKWFKTSPSTKQYWEFFKTRIAFKSTYPAIQSMIVKDDRLYILTYARQKENGEWLVLDLKGKQIKRVFLPVAEIVGLDYYPKYDIYKRNFYYLVENEDDETWELHVEGIW